MFFREGEGGGGGGRSVVSPGGGGGGGGGRRAPSLRLVNGRATTGVSLHTSSTESVRSPHHHLGQQQGGNNNNNNNNHNNNNNCHAGNNPAANNHPRLNKDDSIKISIENTNTCTDSLVTALDDETLLITDFVADTGEWFLFFSFSFFFLKIELHTNYNFLFQSLSLSNNFISIWKIWRCPRMRGMEFEFPAKINIDRWGTWLVRNDTSFRC